MTKLSSLSCLALIALLISTTTANANIQTIQNTLSQGIKISPTETAQNDIQNLIKVANVSFITDFEENNADFAAQDAPEKSSKDICIALGYRKTSCPDGMRLFDRCHNDTRYFRDCVCNECADFPYTKEDIPNGYVITESCQTCDTMKYKAALNPCEGFVKCEKGPAPNAQSCMSGETVKYSQCCQPLPDETDCPSGSDVGDDGCGGKRIICHNPCANVTCGSNEQCKDGICVCNEGYELKDGLCTTIEEDLCANVTCESPQVCKEGKCICEVYISTQPCPKGQICEKLGVCGGCEKCVQDPECASASMVCPDNTECTETDKCGFCTKCSPVSTNITCAEDEVCGRYGANNNCLECIKKPDSCAGVTCESPQVCKEGKCICEVYISTQPCPKGQICEKLGVCGGCDKCVQDPECASASMVCPHNTECTETDKCGFCTKCGYKDPCANVICGSNEHCSNGTCVCDSGYTKEPCNITTSGTDCGKCVKEDPCANVTCGSNEHCSNGTCVCDSGYELKSGKCTLKDPCTGVTCGSNEHCSNGTCVCDSGYELKSGKCEAICQRNPYCYNGTCPGGTKIVNDNCGGKCAICPSILCTEAGYKTGITSDNCETWTTCSYSDSYRKCTKVKEDRTPCASEVCPIALRCTNGCASYTKATKCCPAVCKTCKSTTSTGGGGGRIHLQPISHSVQQNLRL